MAYYKIMTVVAGLTLSSSLAAQPYAAFEFIYEQPLEGVYSQGWSASKIGMRNGPAVDVYVVGTGKLGDFFGVLAIDCETPAFSDWVAVGGYLGTDDVPVEAIRAVRALVCAGN
jgi:hypothetical protein